MLHIMLMTLSLFATSAMAIVAALSHHVDHRLISLNTAVTGLGIAFGTVLILQQPLDMKCALLCGYLVAFAATYIFIKNRNQLVLESGS